MNNVCVNEENISEGFPLYIKLFILLDYYLEELKCLFLILLSYGIFSKGNRLDSIIKCLLFIIGKYIIPSLEFIIKMKVQVI